MPEISEGEYVTKSGKVADHRVLRNSVVYDYEDCIEVDKPIRVKISRQCYAESLVALVEKVGFTSKPEQANYDVAYAEYDGNEYIFVLSPEEQKYWTDVGNDYDLTYRDDLPQIEAWLGYWSDKNE